MDWNGGTESGMDYGILKTSKKDFFPWQCCVAIYLLVECRTLGGEPERQDMHGAVAFT